MTNKLIVIAGPTGVGESTITKELIKRFPSFIRLVTATTRPPRPGEKEGVDYFFLSKAEFENKIKNGEILEYQNTRDGSYYGTLGKELKSKLEQGYNIIANYDIVGTRFFKEKYGSISIFVLPESLESLKKRHVDRNPNIDEKELTARLKYAEHEITKEAPFYDYQVVNKYGQLEIALEEIHQILKKEKIV